MNPDSLLTNIRSLFSRVPVGIGRNAICTPIMKTTLQRKKTTTQDYRPFKEQRPKSELQTLGSSTRKSGFGLVAVNPYFKPQVGLALALSHFFLLYRKSPLCDVFPNRRYRRAPFLGPSISISNRSVGYGLICRTHVAGPNFWAKSASILVADDVSSSLSSL